MLVQYLSVPFMLIFSVLQMTAISRINLLNGSADIILLAIAAWGIREKGRDVILWALMGGLMVSFISAMPLLSPIVPYLATALISRLFQERVWQSPILSMIIVVVAGTIIQHIFSILVLQFTGLDIPLMEGLSEVTLPSLLLNFFFLFPVFFVVNDTARLILKEEIYD